jgi:GNAT superfamily N-acetyltransferase
VAIRGAARASLIVCRRGDLYRGIAIACGIVADVAEPFVIRELRDDELAWASAQYRAIEFAASPPGTVALVAELDGARVGLGRLVAHAPEVVELGGIWTDEAVRGRGVARAMVAALLARGGHGDAQVGREARPAAVGAEHGGRPLWCIPFEHLAAFYQSFGFAARSSPWPAPIATKVAACIAQGLPPVVVLARQPAPR